MCTYAMKPMLKIIRGLRREPGHLNQVYALSDLKALLPDHRDGAFKSVVTRLEKRGDLIRICRGGVIFRRSPFCAEVICWGRRQLVCAPVSLIISV